MSQEKDMSFLEHLEELRWHIIRCSLAIISLASREIELGQHIINCF